MQQPFAHTWVYFQSLRTVTTPYYKYTCTFLDSLPYKVVSVLQLVNIVIIKQILAFYFYYHDFLSSYTKFIHYNVMDPLWISP